MTPVRPKPGAASHGRRFDGKVAVVTGASSGIGRRLALDLAVRGATVVGLARRAELLRELEEELRRHSAHASVRVCDVAETDDFRRVLHHIETAHERIDVMVNNAGVERLTPVEEGPTDFYRWMLDINFFGVVTGTLAVLPGMVSRGSGIVVNVASDAARAPEPGHGAYAASKAAIAAFTESVAHEVGRRGVHVHTLYPAWVPTAMGLSGNEDGGKLPPKLVRRTEEQVSAVVLDRIGGRGIDINMSRLPLVAVVAKAILPATYARAMQRWGA
jgi:short-subunit dehydrogenase